MELISNVLLLTSTGFYIRKLQTMLPSIQADFNGMRPRAS